MSVHLTQVAGIAPEDLALRAFSQPIFLRHGLFPMTLVLNSLVGYGWGRVPFRTAPPAYLDAFQLPKAGSGMHAVVGAVKHPIGCDSPECG